MNQNPVKSIGGEVMRQLTFEIVSHQVFENKDLKLINQLSKTTGLDGRLMQKNERLVISSNSTDLKLCENLFNFCQALSEILPKKFFLIAYKDPRRLFEIGNWQGGRNTWGDTNGRAIKQRLVAQELIDS